LIGVTGASGGVGGRVARRLAAGGIKQRLIVRDPNRLERFNGAEIRTIAGYHAEGDVRRALEGVGTLFLIPATEGPGRTDQHRTAVQAAVAAGVEHLIYLSFLEASPSSTFTLARDHWATEQDVRRLAPSWTFLRMNTYLDFIPKLVGTDGVIAGPAGNGRVSAVLRDDIADVAAAVLADPGPHASRTYDVTGGEAFTLAEAASVMSAASGRRITFHHESVEEAYESRSHYRASAAELDGWVSSYTAIAAGELATISDAVARLAGHQPGTLAEYIRANPDSLAHVES
jgi:uncharacterized protein YbjT (DUF2867 family)